MESRDAEPAEDEQRVGWFGYIRKPLPQSLAVFFHVRYGRLAFNPLSVANDHLSRRMRPTLKGF